MDEYYGSYPVGPNRRQIILRLVAVAVALLVIGAIVIWLLFFHHKPASVISKVGRVETAQQHTAKSSPKPAPQTGQTKSQSSGSSRSTTGTSANSNQTGSATTTQTSGSTSNTHSSDTAGTSTNQGTQKNSNAADLSKTGPGSVIGLFVLTVVLTASLRRWQLGRRSIS